MNRDRPSRSTNVLGAICTNTRYVFIANVAGPLPILAVQIIKWPIMTTRNNTHGCHHTLVVRCIAVDDHATPFAGAIFAGIIRAEYDRLISRTNSVDCSAAGDQQVGEGTGSSFDLRAGIDRQGLNVGQDI